MKKLIIIICFALIASGLYSQKVTAKETSGKFGKITRNSIETFVYHSDLKTVEKEFIKLLKDYKGKVSKKKGIIFGDDLIISTISSNTIDVYATVTEKKDGEVELLVAFDLGGAYLSSSQHPGQFDRALQIVRDFAFNHTEKAYSEFLKGEEKKLQGAEKDFEKLVGTKESLIKDNEDYKNRIENNLKEIERLTKDIEEKEKELKEQKDNFDKLREDGSKIK